MKASQIYPKCQAEEIIRVPGKSQKAGYDTGAGIRTGRTNASVAPVDIYVCASCGYMEYWAASPEALQKIKKKFG